MSQDEHHHGMTVLSRIALLVEQARGLRHELDELSVRVDRVQNQSAEDLHDVHERLGHTVERVNLMQKGLDDVRGAIQMTLAFGSLIGAVALFVGVRALGF